MNNLTAFSVLTSNILGSFNDPFEFQGSYGKEVDPIREEVFDLVVSHEAMVRNLSDAEIRAFLPDPKAPAAEVEAFRSDLINQAIVHDQQHGPPLSELVTEDLIQKLRTKQQSLQEVGFSSEEVEQFLKFIEKYVQKHIFQFMREAPKGLLSLDKSLGDHTSQTGQDLELSIVSSTYPLQGRTITELQSHLMDQLFTKATFALARPQIELKDNLDKLDPKYLEKYFGPQASNRDLEIFCTPAGQILFYWLYQSLNLHIVAKDSKMIDQINKVKQLFAAQLGNPEQRARLFKEQVEASNYGVVFTQECGAAAMNALQEAFLPVERQNGLDGSFVFLRRDLWEPVYEVLPIEGYPGFARGKINLVLATSKLTKEKFLFASCHGDSNNAADGRLQISLIMEKFKTEAQKHPGLQLMIGVDANTKSEQDVHLLRKELDELGLIGTNVGPTTVKKRMVTVQHNKAARAAVDEEDFIITLKPENGGRYNLTHVQVGFKEQKPDITQALPNLENPSDHYAVGARVEADVHL